jgi:hypothetical protein
MRPFRRGAALIGGGAYAKGAEGCIAAAGAGGPDLPCPTSPERSSSVMRLLGTRRPTAAIIAYPTRFEAALSKLLRERGRTKEKLSQIVAEAKPALVVSQTGTADAIRGVDPDDFRLALDEASKRCRRPTPIRIYQHAKQPAHRGHPGGCAIRGWDAHARTAARGRPVQSLFEHETVERSWYFRSLCCDAKNRLSRSRFMIALALASVVVDAAKLTNGDKKEIR